MSKLCQLAVLSIFLVFVSGCTTVHKDAIFWSDGQITRISVASDGVVTAKKDGVEVTADHRGRPSVVELVLGVGVASVTRSPTPNNVVE